MTDWDAYLEAKQAELDAFNELADLLVPYHEALERRALESPLFERIRLAHGIIIPLD